MTREVEVSINTCPGDSTPELFALQSSAEDQARVAGQFCVNHVITDANPDGYDCIERIMHPIATQGPACPYRSAQVARDGWEGFYDRCNYFQLLGDRQ